MYMESAMLVGEDCLSEMAIAEFIERSAGSGDGNRLIESHLDSCADCRSIFVEFSRTYSDKRALLEPGASIGPFVARNQIGAGAMGVVYAAYDEKLDRLLAIKALGPVDSADEAGRRARFIRESKAMARLSHPNVVQIFQVFEEDGQMFIAMELVEGLTLRAWLRDRRRRIDEILSVFAQAGRGLAAAHDAGITHRDFKPENILVGNDGRVRVSDFGLAGPSQAISGDLPPSEVAITQVGAFMGTPAYMSPEQLRGEVADARSDQFSFCVTLYEAIYGERPFAGETLVALTASVLSGRRRPQPSAPRLPRSLSRALGSGLSIDSGQRYPSMGLLLAELAPPRRRILPVVVASLIAVLASSALAVRLWMQSHPRCDEQPTRWTGIWDDVHKQEIHRAFEATHQPFAETTWQSVARSFDRYRDEWQAMSLDACRATRIRREQSEEVMSLRMACLDRRLDEARGLAAQLAESSAQSIARAPQAVDSLFVLDRCSSSTVLSQPRPPKEGKQLSAMTAAQAKLTTLETLARVGKYKEAMAIEPALLSDVRALGSRPLEAEALLAAGQLEADSGASQKAEPLLLDAVAAAEATGYTDLSARAFIALTSASLDLNQLDQSEKWSKLAAANVERMGDEGELKALSLGKRCELDQTSADYDAAEKSCQAALELLEKRGSATPTLLAHAIVDVGNLQYNRSDYDAALTTFRRALVLREKTLGPDHPDVADSEMAIGDVYSIRRDSKGALPHYERALAIRKRALNTDSVDLAFTMSRVAMTLHYQDRSVEAIALLKEAIFVVEKSYGPNHPQLAMTIGHLALVMDDEGRLDEAEVLYARALELRRKTLPPNHPNLATTLSNLGRLLNKRGKYADALRLCQEAVSIDRMRGPNNPEMTASLGGVGRALIGLGRPTEALDPLEQAMRLGPPGKPARASISFWLAKALWESGGDRVRAQTLARKAYEDLAETVLNHEKSFRLEVAGWMKTHPSASTVK